MRTVRACVAVQLPLIHLQQIIFKFLIQHPLLLELGLGSSKLCLSSRQGRLQFAVQYLQPNINACCRMQNRALTLNLVNSS